MPTTQESTHWLARIARKAGLCDSDSLNIGSGTSADDAWAMVCRRCSISETELAQVVAKSAGLEMASFEYADPSSARLVPPSVARQFLVFPLSSDYRLLTIAASNPFDVEMEQAVRFASGRQLEVRIATPSDIKDNINSRYSPEKAAEGLLSAAPDDVDLEVVEEDSPGDDASGLMDADKDSTSPIVRLTNLILREAVERGASDVHIQPVNNAGGVARFRVDGLLQNFMQLPAAVLTRVVSRIKVMGKMDVTVRMRPQDGRARLVIDRKPYDMRISTVPTRSAEKVVIRIPSSISADSLDGLSISPPELAELRELLSGKEGIMLVTGPTGSGKTTTLYAALRELAVDEVNVMTVEDPVEYELPNLTQIQVETKQGVTFASALRAILRQDPDVIFVGEIRDLETAEIAVQAAMTGHFVLATLHTNSAVGVVSRLADLGLDLPSIAESLHGALAQRLVRRLCPDCAEAPPQTLPAKLQQLVDRYGVRPAKIAKGCKECLQSGYRGRIPMVEVFKATQTVKDQILNEASGAALMETATMQGMRSLMEVALERVEQGDTSLDEIERVLGDEMKPAEESTAPPSPTDTESRTPPRPAATAPDFAEDEAAGNSEQPHVLVVDDDGANRTIERALLEKAGCRVTEAKDGMEALRLLTSGQVFTLMVLDLDMPTLGGREVLAAIRANVQTAGIPVIVLTGTPDPEAEVKIINAGADDFIRKPLEPARFMARVSAGLRRARG